MVSLPDPVRARTTRLHRDGDVVADADIPEQAIILERPEANCVAVLCDRRRRLDPPDPFLHVAVEPRPSPAHASDDANAVRRTAVNLDAS